MSLSTTIETVSAIVRGFARMSSSAALSLFHRPTRLSFLEACRNYQHVYLRSPRLQPIAPEDVVDNTSPIHLTQYIQGKWQVSMLELSVVVSLTHARRPAHIFEIGTFDGRTSLNLSLNSPDSVVHTIDLPAGKADSPGGHKPGLLIRELVRDGAIKQLFGDTTQFDFSPWFGTQDLVFVDAGHSYRNALADSRTALRLVEGREGAVIWHDYAVMPGVTRAVEEIKQQVASEVGFHWIKGTSLAVMLARPGHPVRLTGDGALPNAVLRQTMAGPPPLRTTNAPASPA